MTRTAMAVFVCAVLAAAEENASMPLPYDGRAPTGQSVYTPVPPPVDPAREVRIQRGTGRAGIEGKAVHNYSDAPEQPSAPAPRGGER